MGVPENGATQARWMVYKGKSQSKMDDLGYPYFRTPPYYHHRFLMIHDYSIDLMPISHVSFVISHKGYITNITVIIVFDDLNT